MFTNGLQNWVRWVTQHAAATLALLFVATILLGWVAATQFRMNSDLSTLINQDTDWRVDFDRFEDRFPHLVRTAVLVVHGDSLKGVEDTTEQVLDYLRARPQVFSSVAAPGSEAFFRDNALLYMGMDDLDDTADRLAEAQPWLTVVAADPSLRGILRLLGEGLANDPPAGFAKVLELLANSAELTLAGKDGTILWTDELFPLSHERFQLIYLQAPSSFAEALPDAQVMAALRTMVDGLELPGGVSVDITGELALQHEEIEAAVQGVTLAGWLALVLLLLVLIVGVRSAKIILATFSMLAIGVIWTSAYAMLSVGEYNTLSVVFIVMFFGLGVDFALHFSLRYQEAVNRGDVDVTHALLASTQSVGRAISLCTLTTALGFLGFWPTDYQGLADLGVISAGGMAIAWFLTFTFLPAFYAISGVPRAHQMDLPTSEKVVTWLIGHRPAVLSVVVVSGLVALFGSSLSSFDYSVLALKDVQSESMRTLRLLQAEGLSTDYQLIELSNTELDKSRLEALAVVDEVRRPVDYLPMEVEEKLYTVEDIQQILWSALNPTAVAAEPHPQALRIRIQTLLTSVEIMLASNNVPDAVSPKVLEKLRVQFVGLLVADDAVLREWQTAVVSNLLDELDWLRRATDVSAVEFGDLPETVRDRLISKDGQSLSVILPAEDIAPVDALTRFIGEVREVVPHATGRPVIEWGVGRIVVEAFAEAMIFAVASIALVLILALRRIGLVLFILLPLLMAALFTLSLGVVFDKPINMANIIVLPLIFGLGVDNGIHVVERYLGEGDVDHLMHSSTPRAVLMSTLTTVGAFAALSTSPHAGTASIGWLLTVAVGLLLIFTVFLLPVLLSASKRES